MRNDIKNPLFESLLVKANTYGKNLFEQEETAKNSEDLFNFTYELGMSILDGFYKVVFTYPATPYKNKYLQTFPDKLDKIANNIKNLSGDNQPVQGTSGTAGSAGTAGQSGNTGYIGSNIVFQTIELMKDVRAGIIEFVKGTDEDKNYKKFLDKWREDISSGINDYQSSLNGVKKQLDILASKNKVSQNTDDLKKLYQGIIHVKDQATDSIRKTTAENKNIFAESKTILDKLIDNRICLGFNEFNKIGLLESERGDIRRAKKELLKIIQSILGDTTSIRNRINSKIDSIGDDAKNFKSLNMASDFVSIEKEALGIKDELDNENIKVKPSDLTGQGEKAKDVNRLRMDTNSKMNEFEKEWKNEYSKVVSTKSIARTNPEIINDYNSGNAFFATLTTDLNNIHFNAENDIKKDVPKEEVKKEDVKNVLKLKKDIKRSDVPKGQKNTDVEAFQKLVIEKYSKDKRVSKLKSYKDLKSSLDGGQGGYFGPRTIKIVAVLKGGFKLSDTSSSITQELVDKIISAKIQESLILEQEFDYDAAEKIDKGDNSDIGTPKKKSPLSIKTIDAQYKKTKETIIKPQEEVDKFIDSHKILNSNIDARDELDDLKSALGDSIIENPDYGKKGQSAIATSKGFRFFSNKTALRLFDKKMGRYDLKKMKFFGNGEEEPDDLKKLNDGTIAPKKFQTIINDLNNQPWNIIAWCKKDNWSKDDLSILANSYKEESGKSLSKGIKDITKNSSDSDTKIVKNFRTKYDSIIGDN